MKEEVLVENVVEEKVEDSAISPVEETESEVAEALSSVKITAMMSSLSWEPLSDGKLESFAEEIISGILERIPGLTVKTSPNQYQSISFGEKRGRVVCKIWFAKTKVCVETPVLEGRSYKVGASRYLTANGLSKKNRQTILREIKKYIADRGWE